MTEDRCGVCGEPVASDRNFCGNCGAPAGVRAPVGVGAVTAPVASTAVPSPAPPVAPAAPPPVAAPPPPVAAPLPPAPPSPVPPPPVLPLPPATGGVPAGASNRAWLGLAIGILVTIILVAGVLLLTRSDDSTTVSNPPATSAPSTTPSSVPSTATAPSTSAVPSTSAPSSTLPGGIALGPSCTSGDYGYSLQYPAGWYAEKSFPGWQCALFDPSPFTVMPDTEVPPVAVIVSVAEYPFNSSVAQYTDPSYAQLLSSNDVTIAGHKAVAVEIVLLQDSMLPAGTTRYAVLVEWGARTLVIETDSMAAADYTIDKHVVRGMADTLTLPR